MEKIVSISRARRTLGVLAKNLTDNQVRQMINMLHLLAKEQLVYNGSNNEENSHESQQDTTVS
jgi:hypothetical protein